MDYPKISILIPTYNRSVMLKDCIESVLKQDYPDLEVVVSDNASVDDTPEMMKQYAGDKRVRYYRNEKNLGVIPNWKKLLYDYATGEYGKLLCDDDYLEDREHLKKGVELMLREKLDIVISGSTLQKDEGQGVTKELVYDPEIPAITDTIWWLEHGGKKFGQHHLFLNFSSGAIFNIKKAKELQVFIPDTYGPDYEALFRFIISGRVGYLKGRHFTGRYHAANEGTREDFQEAMKGIQIFTRIYEHGVALGLPKDKLLAFKRRNLVVFVNTFLVPKWFREKGVSFKSINGFKQVLKGIDQTIFNKVITSYPTLCWLLRLKNEKLYNILRAIIGKYL